MVEPAGHRPTWGERVRYLFRGPPGEGWHERPARAGAPGPPAAEEAMGPTRVPVRSAAAPSAPAAHPPAAPAPAPRPGEAALAERDARYHGFVARRRASRFRVAALAALALVVAEVLWFVEGALRGSAFMLALGPDITLVAVLVGLLGGPALAYAAWKGNPVGLGVAWLLGLDGLVLGLSEATAFAASGLVLQVLVVLLVGLGLVVLVASTLALASWRGARAQRRIMTGLERPGARRGPGYGGVS